MPAAASVRIGGYSLEVAGGANSFASFEPEHETENAQGLKAALAEEQGDRPPAVAAVEEFQESAAVVTDRIEQAEKLLRTAAEGRLLELRNVGGEINALLDLLGRLDKEGRFEEELRLMRSLNGLLVLALRWYDLVRSLRRLLHSAETAGHDAAKAWTHHELGSLHLCVADSELASTHLQEALRLERELGDLAGRCVTRHNLDSARRDSAVFDARSGASRTRLLRFVGLGAAVAAVAAVAAGIAFGTRGGHQTAVVRPAGTGLHSSAQPTISGTPTSGQQLSTDSGRWTEDPTSFDYEWLRCDSSGAACSAIAGANEQDYLLVDADVGHTLVVRVTAHSETGQGRARSLPTAVVRSAGTGLHSSAQPTISGTPTSGQQLSTDSGRWTEDPTSFDYEWLRCDSSGAACSAIAGANEQDYLLVDADVGHTLVVRVTAHSETGQGRARSLPTAVVRSAGTGLHSSAQPTISGTPTSGQQLSTDSGRWTEDPTSFDYEWLRCDSSGAACSAIAGANEQDYLLVDADVGHTLVVRVTAHSETGQGRARSLPTAVVRSAGKGLQSPAVVKAPGVDATSVRSGWQFTAQPGQWTGDPQRFNYQWEACTSIDTATASCSPISGAISATYKPVPPEPDCNVRVIVIATNGAGSSRPAASQIICPK